MYSHIASSVHATNIAHLRKDQPQISSAMPTSISRSAGDPSAEAEALWTDLSSWLQSKSDPAHQTHNKAQLRYVDGSGRILCATEAIPVREISVVSP